MQHRPRNLNNCQVAKTEIVPEPQARRATARQANQPSAQNSCGGVMLRTPCSRGGVMADPTAARH
eukprot:2091150-Prymnesium_polylepis.2